jgi:hypothetical protein
MSDLSEAEVEALAGALGLVLCPGDLTEVTHRLNAFIDALHPLGDLGPEGPDPLPVLPDPGAAS